MLIACGGAKKPSGTYESDGLSFNFGDKRSLSAKVNRVKPALMKSIAKEILVLNWKEIHLPVHMPKNMMLFTSGVRCIPNKKAGMQNLEMGVELSCFKVFFEKFFIFPKPF